MCCSESEIALKKEKGVDYFKDLGFWGRERPRSPDNAAARGLQSPGHGGGLGRWGLLLLLWVLLVANDRKPTQNPFVGEIPSVGYKERKEEENHNLETESRGPGGFKQRLGLQWVPLLSLPPSSLLAHLPLTTELTLFAAGSIFHTLCDPDTDVLSPRLPSFAIRRKVS